MKNKQNFLTIDGSAALEKEKIRRKFYDEHTLLLF